MRKLAAALLLFLLALPCAWANNLTIHQVTVLGAQAVSVQLSWQTAWNLQGQQAPFNHDAAWLFLKAFDGQQWVHVPIDTATGAHSINPQARFRPGKDGMGGIIACLATPPTGVLQVNLQLQLAQPMPAHWQQIKAMAIEMVHVPAGPFWLGDSLSNSTLMADGGGPRLIDQPGPRQISIKGQNPVTLPADYPSGLQGFYAMKYEISQRQYAAFLSMLTSRQQQTLTDCGPAAAMGTPAFNMGPNFRNGIRVQASGSSLQPAVFGIDADNDGIFNEPNDGGHRACNFLNWQGLAAYLDWAGLRPMTELEFEKAARGPGRPLPKDFAWGAEWPVNANTPLQDGTDEERPTEQPGPGEALANYAGVAGSAYLFGPFRVGFAANSQYTRASIGASYYGLREMSGNLWEQAVSVQKGGGQYTGRHGDGVLNPAGTANVPQWPDGTDSSAIARGGAWHSLLLNTPGYQFNDLAVSDRFYAGWPLHLRRNTTGGRGVRDEE